MRENVCDATFSQFFFQIKIFQIEKSARNLIQNASMFGLIFSVFQTLVIVWSGKSKKIVLLKSFFFGLPIPRLSNASKQNWLNHYEIRNQIPEERNYRKKSINQFLLFVLSNQPIKFKPRCQELLENSLEGE